MNNNSTVNPSGIASRDTCGQCKFFSETPRTGGGDCTANPPVIVDALLDPDDEPGNAVMCATWYPNVAPYNIACRFFVEKVDVSKMFAAVVPKIPPTFWDIGEQS